MLKTPTKAPNASAPTRARIERVPAGYRIQLTAKRRRTKATHTQKINSSRCLRVRGWPPDAVMGTITPIEKTELASGQSSHIVIAKTTSQTATVNRKLLAPMRSKSWFVSTVEEIGCLSTLSPIAELIAQRVVQGTPRHRLCYHLEIRIVE
jgi:hypothetical protein